jgi:hypothetical protein
LASDNIVHQKKLPHFWLLNPHFEDVLKYFFTSSLLLKGYYSFIFAEVEVEAVRVFQKHVLRRGQRVKHLLVMSPESLNYDLVGEQGNNI